MKVFSSVIFLISLMYFVENGNCGVIDRVYGTVENGTLALKDRVTGYWSYGKDMLFGSESKDNEEKPPIGRSVEEPERGILEGIYSGVVNRYRDARRSLHDLFFDQEDGKDKGLVSTMYGRIHNRIAQLQSFIVGNDHKSLKEETNPENPSNIAAVRESLSNFIKAQGDKGRRTGENIRDEVSNVGHKIEQGFEAAKDGLNEFGQDTSKRINDGVHTTNKIVGDKVDDVKHELGASFSNLQENMNDLTEKEKEILNSISTRLRNRVSNVYSNLRNTGDDIKQLSYSGSHTNEV